MNRYVCVLMAAMALLIVAGAAQAADSFFDIFTEVTSGPPYPSYPPVQVMISHEKEPGVPEAGMTETEIMNVSLKSHMLDSVPEPARIQAHGGGGGGGGGYVQSFFDIFTEVSVPTGGYPADSFFDIFVELQPPAIDKASPILAKPPRVTYADSFFDIFVEIDVGGGGGGGGGGGLEELNLHGAIPTGQPASFFDVYYGLDNDCDSFFDIYIEVSCDGPPMVEMPLVTMTMTGTFVPEPASAVLLVAGGFILLARRRM